MFVFLNVSNLWGKGHSKVSKGKSEGNVGLKSANYNYSVASYLIRNSHFIDFIHRVGRTARIGAKGSSIIFMLPSEANFIKGKSE